MNSDRINRSGDITDNTYAVPPLGQIGLKGVDVTKMEERGVHGTQGNSIKVKRFKERHWFSRRINCSKLK